MSEKVIVNKVVADWIEKNGSAPSDGIRMLWILERLRSNKEPVPAQLREQNVDIVTLAKAIQYGYEVPYEFKVGDIVRSSTGKIFGIVEENDGDEKERFYQIKLRVLKQNLNCGYTYKLICKAENREDLK